MKAPRLKVGMRFGRLIVVERMPSHVKPSGGSIPMWRCLCECGNATIVKGENLRCGKTKSCGCLNSEPRKHGHSRQGGWRSPEYKIWASMKGRCASDHKNYGGRGIKVCERWRDDFMAFFTDMGPRPSPKHSIERDDVNGDYEPGNCRWATMKDQQRNRRNTIRIDGQPLAEFCEVFGLSYSLVASRLAKGWPREALFWPPNKGRRLAARGFRDA